MSMVALIPTAFLAGILMFLAPCTLPIVPGYLAFIAGIPEEELQGATAPTLRRRMCVNALAFVIGFSLIFILFGTFAALLGTLIGGWRYTLARGAGLLLILFGITMLGFMRLPLLSREWHMRIPHALRLGHPQSSFLLGALFAFGWSPCIGPILGSILFLASTSTTLWQGAFLLGIFSLGFSLPFLSLALLISEASRITRPLSSITHALQILGGVILIIVGLLMFFNDMGLLVTWGYSFFQFLGYDRLLNYL